jgi:signal transduction histidine kinase
MMRSGSLGPPPQEGIFAAKGDSADPSDPDAERATGTQRSLEASSYLLQSAAPAANMAAVFEAVPTPMIVAFRDNAELAMNSAARALLSLAGQERLRSIAELHTLVRFLHEGEPLTTMPLARALEGEIISALPVVARLNEHDDRTWILDAVPVREHDAIVGAVLTIRDVTERALDEEMGDELLGRAAHDLRTPLTALKASAQLVGRGYDRLDEAARTRTLSLLLAQVEKLATRIDDVVDAARIRRGRYDLKIEDLDLAVVLPEIARELSVTPGLPPIDVKVPEGLRARGDRARLRQILARLMLDASARGSGTRVVIEAQPTEAGVTITIDAVGGTTPPQPHDQRTRTARRFAYAVLERLGGSAAEDRAHRLQLTLPPAANE